MSWDAIKRRRERRALATVERMEWKGNGDIILVPVEDVIVPEGQPKPDPVLVANIAESVQVFGLIQPVAVRIHETSTRKEIMLLAGHAYLTAYRLLGEKTVPCISFPDNEVVAQFVRLSENLLRPRRTVLQEAEEIAELRRVRQFARARNFRTKCREKGAAAR